MTIKNIKAIVFDFGGVMELYGGNSVAQDISEFLHIQRADFSHEFFKHNHLCNVGNSSWEDVMIKTLSFFDDSQKAKDYLVVLMKESEEKRKINTELVDMFPKLKQQGFKIAVFSNHQGKTLRKKLDANGIIEVVDEVIISNEIGFQKPHKEAFDVLFEKLSVHPEETIFIDDTPKSLEKANEIGYMPILFKNNEQLKDELRNFSVYV